MSATPPDEDDTDDSTDQDQDQDPEQPQDGDETQPQDHSSTGTVGTTNQYAVEDYVRTTDDGDVADTTLTIGGVSVPGVYEATQSGAGRKSQYLVETQANDGGGGGQSAADQYQFDADQLPDDGGDGSGSNTDQPPPLTVEASAYVGSVTYAELDDMRSVPATEETFAVELGDISLTDCELVELTRGVSGDQREVYDCTIRVREFREYEVIDNTVDYSSDGGGGGGGGGGVGGGGGRAGTIQPGQGEWATELRQWADDATEAEAGRSFPEPRVEPSLDVTLSGGEALENVYVTGSASIQTSGSGWAVRNVAVEGGGDGWFMPEGDGIIENCYFDGGGAHGEGILVDNTHSGTMVIRFCHIRNFRDNAIYGSEPGNGPSHPTPGSKGQVIIENCYAENNEITDFRIGSDGSFVRRSVGVNNAHRSFWGYYYNTSVIDCDFDGDVIAGDDAWPTPATVNIENSRIGGTIATDGQATINGSSSGTPDLTPPDGVPMGPDAAYQGRFYSPPPGGGA